MGIRELIKKSHFLLSMYEFIFQRPIINYYNRSFDKRVLISYSTYHFNRKNYVGHSNYQESIIIAKAFDSMGFIVDVVNNNKLTKLNLRDYNIIFGEGLPLYQAVSTGHIERTVYYATGSHPWQCTAASLTRLIEFNRKYHKLHVSSLRIQDYRWGIAASCSKNVLCIGNEQTKNTFLNAGAENVSLINPTFHQCEHKNYKAVDDIEHCRKSALWFGSYGLLHKGLDLAVDAVRVKSDWNLHVCGHTDNESDFIDSLNLPANVHVHGFLDIDSDEFKSIARECLYVILPSCSEGIATSVVTAMGREGLIPIVTKECGVDIKDFGILINDLTVKAVLEALEATESLPARKLTSMSKDASRNANKNYSVAKYQADIKAFIKNLADNA